MFSIMSVSDSELFTGMSETEYSWMKPFPSYLVAFWWFAWAISPLREMHYRNQREFSDRSSCNGDTFEGKKWIKRGAPLLIMLMGFMDIYKWWNLSVHFKYLQLVMHQLYLNNAVFKKMKYGFFWFLSVSLSVPNLAVGSEVSLVLSCDEAHEYHKIRSLLPNMSPEL